MMEGGWEFEIDNSYIDIGLNPTKDTINNNYNWSNGNSIHSIGWALLIYIFFIFTSRMQFIYSFSLILTILAIYVLNTYKNNLREKKLLEEKTEERIDNVLSVLLIILLLIFIVGFSNYYIYKTNQYKKSFDFIKFLFGTKECSKL